MADCVSPPTHCFAKARDMAFDDAVEPGLLEMDLSDLRDVPAPHLRAYPREMVIAEKFHAMVMLGRANIRGARGRSLARRFEGFGTRSCYPCAPICRTKYLTSASA
ncbi:nucleotidyl transferase AbiEii/AbiGii toxin family protein [Bradyrhizobium sp. USDA 4486]